MADVLGLDIGGVNTKAAFIRTRKSVVKTLKIKGEYFPIWKRGKEQLSQVLKALKEQLAGSADINAVGATMTAELSDVFFTKQEGVNYILDRILEVFSNVPIWILNTDTRLISIKEARHKPLKVAAANWTATGWIVSQFIKDCIIIDVGSTTTSIIPIINGEIAAKGKTDLEKLTNGELIYTGALRTNVATIVNRIPIRGWMTRVSSELFAQSGDIHLILDNITEGDYIVETADDRGRTKKEAMARLARVVCADINMLSEREIMDMAQFIYEKQIEQIAEGLRQVYEGVEPQVRESFPAVVTGLGRNFLARKAAEKAGLKRVIDLAELLGVDAAIMTPSFSVALMTANKLEGKITQWRQL